MRTYVVVAVIVALVAGDAALTGASAQQSKPKAAAPAQKVDELDRLLAPIALYPDQLLAQMLLCAGTPAKVTELATWLAANKTLTGSELQDAATVDGFEPSFVALALFPQVVTFMAERLDWTTRLGKAFAADRSAVFNSIQRLRDKAHDSGALKSTAQQDVETKTTSSGQQVIVIEPANPQVVYVPQYDPQVVYTQPTTVVVQDNDADAVAAGLIGFTAGIVLGAAIDNDHYYGPHGWYGGFGMYNDAWDDWYDHREDAREDWIDHREDLVEERGERSREAQDQRTDRQGTRQEERTDRQGTRQEQTTTRTQTRQESRGYTEGTSRTPQARSGTSSDAFSGYSSGRSERAASARGQSSRGASRGGGGGRRR